VNITISLSGIAQTKPLEFAVRFVFGGIVTALAGVIATQFGPDVGGMFLAFPSIFPATATLIEKHEAKKKKQEGMQGRYLAKCAAGADAAGAAMGTIGLLAFHARLAAVGIPRAIDAVGDGDGRLVCGGDDRVDRSKEILKRLPERRF
jgi:hypothetical protein